MWATAEDALRHVLESEGTDYQLNPGDGAFYGPKIDFHIRDVMGRSWQCGTIQVDFAMPETLDITYTGADNEEHRPVMIHRAMLGSIERFMGILLEHYGGNLPTWLAPVQALVLPVSDRHAGYATGVMEALRVAGLRAELDDRSESVGKRIRDGQLQKVPYLLVVGDREEQARAVARARARRGDRRAAGRAVRERGLSRGRRAAPAADREVARLPRQAARPTEADGAAVAPAGATAARHPRRRVPPAHGRVVNLTTSGHTVTMERVTVAQLKSRLSYYLREVRAGRSFTVVSRDIPVATLSPHDAIADDGLVSIPPDPSAPPLSAPVFGGCADAPDAVELIREGRGDRSDASDAAG